jgi:expansin (peptidoglycan-binding protein)
VRGLRRNAGDAAGSKKPAVKEGDVLFGKPKSRRRGMHFVARGHWLGPLVAGVGVLCSVALVTGISLQFAGAACAVVPRPNVVHQGTATFFDGGANGNCSYPTAPADRLFVALSPDEYSDAAACGGYLDVTGPKGSVRVKVIDQCPECDVGHIDLSREAFTKIADPVAGVVPVSYRAVVNPAVPGRLSVRVKEGSSEFFLALLIDNHGNPLTRVEVTAPGHGTQALTRTDFNYWIFDAGLGAGPFTVRVTDQQGRTATLPGITLSPGQVQQTNVAMSGGGGSVVPPPVKPAPTTSKKAPTKRSTGTPRSSGGQQTQAPETEAPPLVGGVPVPGALVPSLPGGTAVPLVPGSFPTSVSTGSPRPARTWTAVVPKSSAGSVGLNTC